MNLEDLELRYMAALLSDRVPPLDVAVGLLAEGIDVSAIEGHSMFDPYFND